MSEYISLENLKFNLFEVLEVDHLFKLDRFQDFDKEGVNLLIKSLKDYADKNLYPVFKEMDEQGAYYRDGKIIVHPMVGQWMRDAGENGWIAPHFNYDHGGFQLPHTLQNAFAHIIECANNNITGYTGLTAGSAHLIVNFGTQELIDTYVPKMVEGEWGGTMCLTEPQAGSSLSDISTSAKPREDGSYSIKGHKIFISGGDHEYCENFIHLVLARIEGAPAGTKGISLFFGEENDCHGWLVGTENKGLKHMFQMMNGARIDVGMTAASVATAAYYASLQYAKERPQGRRILAGGVKNTKQEQTTIINHPDVRRMLLSQRAITEGAVSLLLQCSMYHDLSLEGDEEDKERNHDLMEILTPIAKTYPSEAGRDAINDGLQILGGYGFCTDFPLEQYYRDIRIMSLYEGTTGIQSLDLLGKNRNEKWSSHEILDQRNHRRH